MEELRNTGLSGRKSNEGYNNKGSNNKNNKIFQSGKENIYQTCQCGQAKFVAIKEKKQTKNSRIIII